MLKFERDGAATDRIAKVGHTYLISTQYGCSSSQD